MSPTFSPPGPGFWELDPECRRRAIAGRTTGSHGDRGMAPVSHAAVLSRELGLTAVIGARGAMESINDGDVIELDPHTGRVRLVERVS